MKLLPSIYQFLFGFNTYKRGLIIHLSLLFFYSLFFIGAYFLLRLIVEPPDLKAYRQVQLSQLLVICMIMHLLTLMYFRWEQLVALVKEYFTEKGSPYNLAIFRILFFFKLGGHFLFQTLFFEIAWTHLPDSSRVSLPLIGWMVQNIPINPTLYAIFSVIAGVLCWLICIGLFTRQAALLLLPFAFYVLGVPMFFGKMNHYHILFWVPLLLCLAPMTDVWSVDAWIRKKRNRFISVEPHMKYFLSFKLMWLVLAIIYVFAGIIKLWDCGLDWALSDSMINQMRWEWVENYDRVPRFRLDNYPVLAKLSGMAVIYFELLYFLLLIKPKGRIWALIGGFSLHKLCGYFMYIDFADLRLVAASYIDWPKIKAFFTNKFKPLQVKKETLNENKLLVILKKEKLKPAFIIGLILITMNFILSACRINSFPFSSYPTYSAIIKDEIKVIRLDAFTADNKKVDVKQLGIKENFRWENIRQFEMRIADAFENKDSMAVRNKIEEYWMLWRNNVKNLDNITRVDMFLETSSIVPERRKEILKTEFVGTVNP